GGEAWSAQGGEGAVTCEGEGRKKGVEPLAAEVGGLVLGHCDVGEPATIDAVFGEAAKRWGTIDFLLHAIAFSDKDQLIGRYVDTAPDNFPSTKLISVYSFGAVAQRAEKLMPDGGSLRALTYYSAEKWIPQ